MDDKYQQLREALKAGPTPGPRTINEVGKSHRVVVRNGHVSGVMAFVETGWPHPEQQAEQRANALLIAAANPATIAALLTDLDTLRQRLEISDKSTYDGIASRDETIRGQDALIDRLRGERYDFSRTLADRNAYLRTLANFGGTLQQARELAQKALA